MRKDEINLHDRVSIKNTNYEVIGIDSYSLTNYLNNKKQWTSYTLKSKKSKLWLVLGVNDKPLLWRMTSPKSIKSVKEFHFDFEFSGIANIEFRGDKGFSTPKSEIVFLKKGNKYFVIEKFLGDIFCFLGEPMAHPLKITKS